MPNSTIFVIVHWVSALIDFHIQMTGKHSTAMCYGAIEVFLQQAGLLTREALSEAIKVLLTKIRRRRLAKAFHEFDDHRQSMI